MQMVMAKLMLNNFLDFLRAERFVLVPANVNIMGAHEIPPPGRPQSAVKCRLVHEGPFEVLQRYPFDPLLQLPVVHIVPPESKPDLVPHPLLEFLLDHTLNCQVDQAVESKRNRRNPRDASTREENEAAMPKMRYAVLKLDDVLEFVEMPADHVYQLTALNRRLHKELDKLTAANVPALPHVVAECDALYVFDPTSQVHHGLEYMNQLEQAFASLDEKSYPLISLLTEIRALQAQLEQWYEEEADT